MSLALLFHYLMLNMFRMLIHPSSGACDLFVRVISWVVLLWFDVCWCYVVVWLWWCGIRMQAEGGRCVRLITLPPSCSVVMKSGNLNFLEPSCHSRPVTALRHLYLYIHLGY